MFKKRWMVVSLYKDLDFGIPDIEVRSFYRRSRAEEECNRLTTEMMKGRHTDTLWEYQIKDLST